MTRLETSFLSTFEEICSYPRESFTRAIRCWRVGSSGLGVFFPAKNCKHNHD